jgi:pimeloyl-ACP methyl ester carboxylesterase
MLALAPAYAARPPGRFVDLGGWSLYLNCEGRGAPTFVIEPGLGDFAVDWRPVQDLVKKQARICAYDRAGYGFSDAGPLPRTYDQINLELHRLLQTAGERGPFILVGHSFGGPLVRHYAETYASEVAGIVQFEAAHEDLRVFYGGAAHRLRAESPHPDTPIPPPKSRMIPQGPDAPRIGEGDPASVEADYAFLSLQERRWRAWAQNRPSLSQAISSETEWSPQYLAAMFSRPQNGVLGSLPLLVVTRRNGGYEDLPGDLGTALETERVAQQRALVALTSRGKQVIVDEGHNPNLSNPALTAKLLLDFAHEARAAR